LTAYDTKVEVFRTDATLGSGWPNGWAFVGETVVAEIQAGTEQVVSILWPEEEIPKAGHYCFYVRLTNADDPLNVTEKTNAVQNTYNNNNIAWRNFNVVDLLKDVKDIFNVNVVNLEDEKSCDIDLVFEEEDNLLENDGVRVLVNLGVLFKQWNDDGALGENIRVVEGQVQLLATPAKIQGICMEAGEIQSIQMRVEAFKPMPVEATSVEYRFSAQEFISGELIGGVDYILTMRGLLTDTDNDEKPDVIDDDDDNDEVPDEEDENPLDPTVGRPGFTGGVFIVGPAGQITVDWLYDGGAYKGEFGIFSLAGMDDLISDMTAFIKEAVRRVRSNSEDGYLLYSDPTEAAHFPGTLGKEEKDWNSGIYPGRRENLPLRPGDRFATILVPNSTFQALYSNPATADAYKRPLFSLISANPAYGMYLGQVADVNGKGRGFVYEDMNVAYSDRDYNDLIIQIEGATVENIPSLDSMFTAERRKRGRRDSSSDWRTDTELGRLIMEHLDKSVVEPDDQWFSVEVDASVDALVYDADGRVIGKEGGLIPGAHFVRTDEGRQIISLPALESGDYEYTVMLQSATDTTCQLTVKKHIGETEVLTEETAETEVAAHRTLKSEVFAASSGDDLTVDFGMPEIPTDAEGNPLIYDFEGDGDIDDDDIEKVRSIWNTCEGDADYDPFFDLDDDGCITVLDIMPIVNGKSVH
jgi:hypothetical protein